MIRIAMLALTLTASTGYAAEPIVGSWKTASGETATIGKCGGSYCVTLKTGKYAGRQIGKMAGSNGEYKGEVTVPSSGKTYSGSAKVNGNSLNMKGCVLGLFCKSQTWTRR